MVRSKTQDLTTFLTVVDSGSFSKAANLLEQNVAQVSRAVARLETQHHCTLFNRTTRRIELTQEGERFAEQIRQGLTALATAESELSSAHASPKGVLRIDAASPFVLHQIVPHIKAFQKRYPDIRLEITSHDNIIDLLEHKTDVAIRVGELSNSNLHAKKLGESPLHLVASAEFLKQYPIEHIDDLTNAPLIGFSDAPALNKWPLIPMATLAFHIKASSGETVRQLCLNGMGVAMLSRFMCQADIDAGRLVALLPQHVQTPNRRESVHAVYYRHSAVAGRIRAFLDFMSPRFNL